MDGREQQFNVTQGVRGNLLSVIISFRDEKFKSFQSLFLSEKRNRIAGSSSVPEKQPKHTPKLSHILLTVIALVNPSYEFFQNVFV